MPLFVVIEGAEKIATVRAKHEKNALDVYARNNIDDPLFREEVESMAVNMSLMEHFFKDEHGHFLDDIGEASERISGMREEERKTYINNWVERNARAFWGDEIQYAHEYMNEWHKSLRDETYQPSYSDAFLIDTFKRLVEKGLFFGEVKVVPIDESLSYQLLQEN
ncbi:hypothetical protein IMZ31_18970 (plasmid) [Pontibacillus sp. ALD_SL1]|uniref:hypothetical protein n=1 Tax=Pontibacillus sp. ALD_SL1 TaxID=2777185 RepID=UPI001A965897|nr:hypothetical protein [Pontibacillus sp. ALD_SL1]QST02632.1 hypothetical protein IMZ31_18970 [Pontibacillus sp. ALD_SL1]